MVHVHLRVSHRDWLEWAYGSGIHPLVIEYIQTRPDHLWSQPPKHEETFSTPRSWHILSDALHEYGDRLTDETLEVLAHGCLTPHHAGQFKAFVKHLRSKYALAAIIKGETSWPHRPEDRDVLYFLSQSFRAQIVRELSGDQNAMSGAQKEFAHRAKALLRDLAGISLEMAQMVVADQGNGERLPGWFMVEVVRDLPRLVEKKGAS
jgi:hypothetical protein